VHIDNVREDDGDTVRGTLLVFTLTDEAAELATLASTLLLSTWAALPALAFVVVTICIYTTMDTHTEHGR
jgi:hypothetical protein